MLHHLRFLLVVLLIMGRLSAGEEPRPGSPANPFAGKRVMVLGDSITQDGTYVAFMATHLLRTFPTQSLDLINLGLASETASGLSEPNHAGGSFARPCIHTRLERALIAMKPAVVMACYGMNDGIYLELDPVRERAYQDGITRLVQVCQAHGAEVVLVTPPVYEGKPFKTGSYDDVLTAYAAWIMAAPLPGVKRIDLHTAMRQAQAEQRKTDPRFRFTKDGVHPGASGHLVMAQVILTAFGIESGTGDLAADVTRIQLDQIFPLVRDWCTTRAGAWMDHVGYSRGRTVPPGTGNLTAREAVAAGIMQRIDAGRMR